MDVEESHAIRQAEVGALRTIIHRTEEDCFGIKPDWLAGDTAYGSAANLGWRVDEGELKPHTPIIDKSGRDDGTFSRSDLTHDPEHNVYVCPAGCLLKTPGRVHQGTTLLYLACVPDCRQCPLKEKCCPNAATKRTKQYP